MLLVSLYMLLRILDIFKLLVLLQLLTVKQLQSAVSLDQVHATLHHHYVFRRFLKKVVNLLELLYDSSATSYMVVYFTIYH